MENRIIFKLKVSEWSTRKSSYNQKLNIAKKHFSSDRSNYFTDLEYRKCLQEMSSEMMDLRLSAFDNAKGTTVFSEGTIYTFIPTEEFNELKNLHDEVLKVIDERINFYQGNR